MNAIRLVTEDAADPENPKPIFMQEPVEAFLAARMRVAMKNHSIAAAARAKGALAIKGTLGGAAANREVGERETIKAGVKETFMRDEDVLECMGLSRRQKDAAEYLRGLWADCLPGYEAPMAYASGGGGKRHLSADQEAAAARAWFDYRKAMDRLPGSVGDAVRDAVLNGIPRHPPTVKDGLDVLADYWRMAKDVVDKQRRHVAEG